MAVLGLSVIRQQVTVWSPGDWTPAPHAPGLPTVWLWQPKLLTTGRDGELKGQDTAVPVSLGEHLPTLPPPRGTH